ncbi:hypothetical protein PV327_006269 [Microctonus hyperodae]|uniref:phospholipase A1 n=1 Tax=Microctonus hyperodae TaxID=165561 RepID=A0AA39F420_MICHY|nr:hypothetical protein PV327_006269 [Microctonus hyperodae]
MVFPLLVAGYISYCYVMIPTDLKSETFYDPYSCDNCPDINDDIQFRLYTKSEPNESYILRPNDDSTLLKSPFNPEHKTFIFIHGFKEHANSKSARTIKNALLQSNDCNVIIVNWGNLSKAPDYCKVISRMPVTGTYVAQMIKWLESTFSISRTTFHVIGFSLGAHVSGLAGEALARNDTNNIKIGRITGLDPAGPAFDTSNGLDRTDATFVDIIHTNTIKYGIKKPIGHVDFYVNYGYRQPGCFFHKVGCSHRRAWKIFAESILTPYEFPAFKCGKAGKWRKTKLIFGILSDPQSNCQKFEGDYLGFIASSKSVGKLIVFTNDRRPYGNNWGISPSDEMEESHETKQKDHDIVHDNDEVSTFNYKKSFDVIDEDIPYIDSDEQGDSSLLYEEVGIDEVSTFNYEKSFDVIDEDIPYIDSDEQENSSLA